MSKEALSIWVWGQIWSAVLGSCWGQPRPGNGIRFTESRENYSHRFWSCELATSIDSQHFTCNSEIPKAVKAWTLKILLIKWVKIVSHLKHCIFIISSDVRDFLFSWCLNMYSVNLLLMCFFAFLFLVCRSSH